MNAVRIYADSVLLVNMDILLLLVPLIPLTAASWIDLKTREIPDVLSICVLLIGFVAATFGWAGIRWWMVLSGLAVGLIVGLALFRFAKFGGGDAKVIAGVGAVLGPVGIWFFLFWMALVGGVLALVARSRGQRDYAYGPALLLGYIGYLIFPADIFSTIKELMTY